MRATTPLHATRCGHEPRPGGADPADRQRAHARHRVAFRAGRRDRLPSPRLRLLCRAALYGKARDRGQGREDERGVADQRRILLPQRRRRARRHQHQRVRVRLRRDRAEGETEGIGEGRLVARRHDPPPAIVRWRGRGYRHDLRPGGPGRPSLAPRPSAGHRDLHGGARRGLPDHADAIRGAGQAAHAWRAVANQLGRLTAMDRATIQGVIRRLEERQLIERSGDPGDRRRSSLRLTPSGETLVAAMIPCGVRVSAVTLQPLDEGEQKTFLALLRKFA